MWSINKKSVLYIHRLFRLTLPLLSEQGKSVEPFQGVLVDK